MRVLHSESDISSTNTAYPYLSSPMMLLTSATDSNTFLELCTEGVDFASQWALELESVARDISQAGRDIFSSDYNI